MKRGNPPNLATWGLPGGAIELGETVTQAVSREVMEETGVEIDPIRFLTVLDSIHSDENGQTEYHYILLEYLCEAVAGVPSPRSDVLEARWVPLQQLDLIDIAPGTARFILEAASKKNIRR